MGPNSSSAIERFQLGLNESKVFETLAPGGNKIALDVSNPINQGSDGVIAGNANGVVLLEKSEDGTTYSTVATLTVVPGGIAADQGQVGKFCRIRNTGSGIVVVVAKPLHRIQPKVSL